TWDTRKTYEQAAKIGVHWLYISIIMLVSWEDKTHGMTIPAEGPYRIQTLLELIGFAEQTPIIYTLCTKSIAGGSIKVFYFIAQESRFAQ
ncbi:hypothetical protein H5410_015904, partial [Solanum commersonii]